MKKTPTVIIAEGIWRYGGRRHFQVPWPGCSTSVAMMWLKSGSTKLRVEVVHGRRGATKVDPWLTRIFHDGVLVREFDSERERYTLAIDGGCDCIPPKVPVPEPVPRDRSRP